MATATDQKIYLQCVRESARSSKLRVRIVSGGFPPEANCQFPRDIRTEGRYFSVPYSAITLAAGPRGKYFYRVLASSIAIETTAPGALALRPVAAPATAAVAGAGTAIHVARIFEDPDNPLCCVCLTNNKQMVFVPCGHLCTCSECTPHLRALCPLCRATITVAVTREMLG